MDAWTQAHVQTQYRRASLNDMHGMAWHGMAWHGMAWHGMARMHSRMYAHTNTCMHACICMNMYTRVMHTAMYACINE